MKNGLGVFVLPLTSVHDPSVDKWMPVDNKPPSLLFSQQNHSSTLAGREYETFTISPPGGEMMESIGLPFVTFRSVLISWQSSGDGEIYASLLP